jgi:hypothetical protein
MYWKIWITLKAKVHGSTSAIRLQINIAKRGALTLELLSKANVLREEEDNYNKIAKSKAVKEVFESTITNYNQTKVSRKSEATASNALKVFETRHKTFIAST